MDIKVVNVGKCIICGKPIKLVVPRGYSKLPNICFCRECEQKLDGDIVKTVDWHEWCCDEKECPYEAESEDKE